MVIISLILLLLSNSITFKRDKSILYSRATITILLIYAFIAYDNLFFLFLNKGIGIFKGLFALSATTYVFPIFIFLISSVILLLASFFRKKDWLSEYSSPARLLSSTLKSGTNHIVIKIGTFYIITTYDMYAYDNLVNCYQSITDTLSSLNGFNFGSRPMHTIHPIIRNMYDMYIAMKDTEVNIRPLLEQYTSRINFSTFTSFHFNSHLSQFHINLDMSHSIQKLVLPLIGPLVLVLAVSLHSILISFVELMNAFNDFFKGLIKRCTDFYDPVRDTHYKAPPKKSTGTTTGNDISKVTSNKLNSTGNDSDEDDERDNKNPFVKDWESTVSDLEELFIVLEYIRNRIIASRQSVIDNNTELLPERRVYSAPLRNGILNENVTLIQIIRYAIEHPNEIVPSLGIPLSSILSSIAKSKIIGKYAPSVLRSRIFTRENLINALLYYQDVQDLLRQVNFRPAAIGLYAFIMILRLLNGLDP